MIMEKMNSMNEINVALTLDDIDNLQRALSVADQESQLSEQIIDILDLKLNSAKERLLNNGK